MIRKIILTTGIAILTPNLALAEQGDVLCEFQTHSGLREELSEKERKKFFGTGFIANSNNAYVQKYDDGKKGIKQAVTVKQGPSFVTYRLDVDGVKIYFRTYEDGNCYLQFHRGGYEPIWIRGQMVE